MSSENRVWTQNLNQELTAAHINDLQDSVVMSWELGGSSLAPTVPLEGGVVYYGQFTVVGGAAPNLTQLDASRDWRHRPLLTHVKWVGAANQLPKGAAYNPDTDTWPRVWNLWYTGAGATAGAPPVGIFWTTEAVAGECLFAASAAGGGMGAGDLCWYNPSGASRYVMIWVLQLAVGS